MFNCRRVMAAAAAAAEKQKINNRAKKKSKTKYLHKFNYSSRFFAFEIARFIFPQFI